MLTNLVDYNFYTNTYEGSSIPESSFNNFALKASTYVNKNTFNRITEEKVDSFVKYCICEVAELLYSQEKKKNTIMENKIVSSETVGPHSKTYVNNSSYIDKDILTESELETMIYKICYRYLATTGLLYRGF